jgi:hypothetical protein
VKGEGRVEGCEVQVQARQVVDRVVLRGRQMVVEEERWFFG